MPSIVEIGRRHAVHYEKMVGALFEIYKLSGILGAGLFDLHGENIWKAWSWSIDLSSRHRGAAKLCALFPRGRAELFGLRLAPARLVHGLQRSLACAKRQGDEVSVGRLLRDLGAAHASNGAVDQSLICYRRSAEICRKAGDSEGEAIALSSLGKAYAKLNDNVAALDRLERSLGIFRKIGTPAGEAEALNGLGAAQLGLGRAQEAIVSNEQALAIYRRIDDYRGEAAALCGLADARVAVNQVKEASELYGEALIVFRQLSDQQGETQVLSCISRDNQRLVELAGAGRQR